MGCLKLNIDYKADLKISYNKKELTSKKSVEKGRSYQLFGLRHKGYNNNPIGPDHKYGFGGKEEQDDNVGGSQLNWLDFGARNYDAALGRWMNIDPVAEIAPSLTPYRYAFNNPLSFIDPDGLYEWRVNTETGEFERIGNKGGDESQYVFFNDDKEATGGALSGSQIYVGAKSNGWYKDGDISYGVSTVDLWSDLPDEYQGAYTMKDLVERYEKKQDGGIEYQSIREQENAGLARRDQIWNARDYGRYMDRTFGSRSAFLMAADTGILEEMFSNLTPGLEDALKVLKSYQKGSRKFLPKLNKASTSVGSSNLSKNSWIRFLQVNKGKYKGLGKNWIKQAASDYNALKNGG